MSVQLNHTIVHARDSRAAARFVSEILGLPAPTRFGPFEVVQTANGVSLDFLDTDERFDPQHYAFLISEAEFDEIFARIRERGIPHWADPGKTRPGRINHGDGGRGVYFEGPDGHFLEMLTRPYGSSGGQPS
jgi:catechol 2,3-dioxygenase-like lactoylglutathione lyase family enzyme